MGGKTEKERRENDDDQDQEGMSCQHCVMAVTKALGVIEGIKDVRVDLQKGEATFTEEKPVDPNGHPGADSESRV